MPMYEFECRECDHAFEALVFDGEQVDCPECHGQKLKRLLSVPAKPRNQPNSLPMQCNPKLPPCGPGCCGL
jgi:putative FmdB family regulatory protein